MKKILGMVALLTVTAGLAVPASAAPGGRCQAPVDTQCKYTPPGGEERVCDYYIHEPALNQRNFCGELPGVGPVL